MMRPDVTSVVRRTSLIAAAAGAVLSPIPLADEVLLLPAYGWLAVRVGREHGLGWREVPWRPVGLTALRGLGARAALNLGVSFVPGVAAVANAASAYALTHVFGEYLDRVCAAPAGAKAYGPGELLAELRERMHRSPAAPAATGGA